MQLVAYGAQDIYLTGNPMITYFKVVYRRHTNFAMESIEQTFNGTAEFGNKVSCLISRNGDLVSGLTLQATLPSNLGNDRWTENVGHYLIKEVSVDIGGQQIDKHYGDWLEIWSQLTIPAGKKDGYLKLIGQYQRDPIGQPTGAQREGNTETHELFIPLQFWFCRNVGLALPLIALQYHEVKVNIEFETRPRLSMDNAGTRDTVTTGLTNVGLWADYIYLDTDERRRFAQVSHEYLIEQLQYSGELSTSSATENSFKINLNHPVKELVWVTRETASETANQWCNYTTTQAVDTTAEVSDLDPSYGTAITTTTADTGDAFTATAHGLNDGDAIKLVALDTTTGITVGVRYYVISAAANTFQLALTTGGDAVALTTNGTASVSLITPVNLASITTQKYFQTGGAAYAAADGNPTSQAKLKLNGHDRFASRSGKYFNLEQTCKHHTSTPVSPGINVYSFALKPEDHQPSGSCNFSRIDNAQLLVTTPTLGAANTKIFAVNYNVLRIMSGMGGLAYSN
jgi:hypothetical protein